MTELVVRTVRAEDLQQVNEIETSSFPDPYDASWFRLFRLRAKESFIVASEGVAVLGYSVALVDRRHAHLVSMAVSPARRHRGVGKALLKELVNRLTLVADEITLEVQEDNAVALHLYEAFGFRRTGEVKERYYPGGEDAFVMSRILTPADLR